MRTKLPGIILVLILTTSNSALARQNTSSLGNETTVVTQSVLICTFQESASVKREPSGEISSESGTIGEPIVLESGGLNSETIILAGLDSSSPVLRANLGESKLEILRRTKEVIWLVEKPPLGGVNIYALFLKSRTVIESKQQLFLGNEPYGSLAIGECK